MKKLSILLLTLSVLLCGCDNDAAVTTTNVTTAETTTAAETLPVVPAMEVPEVITAEKYEKEIVDVQGWTDFDYPHSVEYPKIDSDKAGALALNEKIAEKYTKIINELKNGEEGRNIYNIYYLYSVCDGIIFINVIESTGWQYSEGMTEQKIFYYDAINDKELTSEEYALYLGIDLEKAKESILYTHELARSYMDDTSVIVNGTDDKVISEPAAGILFPAKQSQFDYKFDGLEVTDSEINLYYNGQQYVLSIYKFALDRKTLEPKHPHYMGYVQPNNSTSSEVKITLENGTVTEYSIPEATGIYNIKISSMAISVYSKVRLEDWKISVNGGESYTSGGQFYAGENQYQYDFSLKEYLPVDALKTIEFFGYQPQNAPEVVIADRVTKTAIDTLAGGEFGFTHKVEYPRINSSKPGAEALNKKIGEKYQKIIVELMNDKEAQYLYDISYETSTRDDIIFIRMKHYTGWQYSEGAYSQVVYYYDVTNDREIDMTEYCKKLGIDLEKATLGVLASYDLANAGYGGLNTYHTDKVGGEPIGAPAPNEIHYLAYDGFNDTVKLDGVELNGEQIHLYYSGHAYISNIFKCTVAARTYMPIRPNYAGYVMPSEETPENDKIELTFKGGRFAELSLPSEYDIYAIAFTSSGVNVHSNKHVKIDSFYVDGIKQEGSSSQGVNENGGYSYYAEITDYVPLENLQSIKFEITK